MAKSLDALKVRSFTSNRVPNDYPGGDLPWQTYHSVRNALVQTCRRFGSTGPLGVLTIVEGAKDLTKMLVKNSKLWEIGDQDPMYFLVDDQMNHERYCYLEVKSEAAVSKEWLAATTETLKRYEGWGLAVSNIPESYLLVFGNRLMVKGRLAKCRTAAEVVAESQRLLKRGEKKWWQFWK